MILTSLDTAILRYLAAVDEAGADELACVARADPPAVEAECVRLAETGLVRQSSASIVSLTTGVQRAATWEIATAGRWVVRGVAESKVLADETRRRHPAGASLGGDVA